jgi:GrpB-like predicted nucleotidyltransferase (UPF0157 family)
MMEPVELHPPSPDWPAAFERERQLLEPLFPDPPMLIEHMGSTSIPGLPAKPIIDIIVLVERLKAAHQAVPALEAVGYSFWRDNPDKSKLYLVKGLPPAPHRTHHLHIYDNGDEVRRHLVFRDRLRADADARQRYLTLKQELAERHRIDREAYSDAKSAFIDAIVAASGGPPRLYARQFRPERSVPPDG